MSDPDKERELKEYFFKEYTLLMNERADNKRIYDKFVEERAAFTENMKQTNANILAERKRLKDDNVLFDKRLAILQSGFAKLDADRRELEQERREFEQLRRSRSPVTGRRISGHVDASVFFAGVDTETALKKRYRDLLKIFHPDNKSGDDAVIQAINEEYYRLKKTY